MGPCTTHHTRVQTETRPVRWPPRWHWRIWGYCLHHNNNNNSNSVEDAVEDTEEDINNNIIRIR